MTRPRRPIRRFRSRWLYIWRRYHLDREVEGGFCVATTKRAALREVRSRALQRVRGARRFTRETVTLFGSHGLVLAAWEVSTSGVVRL